MPGQENCRYTGLRVLFYGFLEQQVLLLVSCGLGLRKYWEGGTFYKLNIDYISENIQYMESKLEIVNDIRLNYNELNNIRIKSVFRENLGIYSLDHFKIDHEKIIKKLSEIIENSEILSKFLLKDISVLFNEYLGLLRKTTDLNDKSYIERRNSLAEDYQSLIDRMEETWQTAESRIANFKINDEYDKLSLNLKTSVDNIDERKKVLNTELEKTIALQKSLEQQAEEYKERYSNINANVELETQVNIFEAQAIKNKEDSVKWLWGIVLSGILLIATLIYIYCNFGLPAQDATNYTNYNDVCETCGKQTLWVDMIRHLFFKILILSVETYILTFCVKNYNAAMHNKTNNEHRHNSFAAALHFYNTTTSERREEILIKVADAIFTYQKSGYYGKDSEPSNPSIVQNVIEKVTGK